jgi:hypothetical protein
LLLEQEDIWSFKADSSMLVFLLDGEIIFDYFGESLLAKCVGEAVIPLSQKLTYSKNS